MDSSERKRIERARKRALGLKPYEVWVKPHDIGQIRLLESMSQDGCNIPHMVKSESGNGINISTDLITWRHVEF
jgi:hypothetical protein